MALRTIQALLAIALTAPLTSQTPHSSGPLVGCPAAVYVGPGTTDRGGAALDTHEVLAKKPGFDDDVAPWSTPGTPDFATLFDPGLEVDAFSLGVDRIASSCAGVSTVGPGAWVALLFAVDRATTGTPSSVIADEAGATGGASADIFSYVLEDSTLPRWFGETQRALDSTEIGLAGPSDGQISALDAYLPLFTAPVLRGSMPTPVRVYFSLTSASAASAPIAWFRNATWPTDPASGATILQAVWTGATWIKGPFMPFHRLGLASTDELDAVAYDRGKDMVLFSLQGVPLEEQLKIACPAPDSNSMMVSDYKEPSGETVAEKTGAGPGGEITAVCEIDPGFDLDDFRSYAFSTPRPPLLLPWASILDAASYRSCASATQDAFYSVMVGWPGGTPEPGFAFFFIGVGGAWSPAFGMVRDPANPVAGDPQSFEFTLPAAAFGVFVDVLWLARNSGGTAVGLSYQVRVAL